MADDSIEVRLVATDELSPVFADAAQNVQGFLARIAATTEDSTATEAEAWRGMLREIDAADDLFVYDVIARRETLTQSLLDMSTRLLEGELANDLKFLTNYALLSAFQLDTDRLVAEGGVLVHLLAETAKTNATVSGVAERTAAEQAGASAGLVAQVAGALKAIAIDAAETFAGIFAFLAPLMGPAAAGPAAAGEAAVYAAAGSIAAFDVGAWSLPSDMLGLLHAGEMVVPESFASGLRASAGGGDGGAGGAGLGALNINMALSALDARGVKALLNDPTTLRMLARNLQAYLALNPSVRGSY